MRLLVIEDDATLRESLAAKLEPALEALAQPDALAQVKKAQASPVAGGSVVVPRQDEVPLHVGFQHLAGVGDGIAAGAVHLGGAAQGIGVLNPFAVPM